MRRTKVRNGPNVGGLQKKRLARTTAYAIGPARAPSAGARAYFSERALPSEAATMPMAAMAEGT